MKTRCRVFVDELSSDLTNISLQNIRKRVSAQEEGAIDLEPVEVLETVYPDTFNERLQELAIDVLLAGNTHSLSKVVEKFKRQASELWIDQKFKEANERGER